MQLDTCIKGTGYASGDGGTSSSKRIALAALAPPHRDDEKRQERFTETSLLVPHHVRLHVPFRMADAHTCMFTSVHIINDCQDTIL